MCLSTVYKNNMAPESVVMRNVMSIECRDDSFQRTPRTDIL